MLSLVEYYGNGLWLVQYEAEERGCPTLNDWSVRGGRFDTYRSTFIQTSYPQERLQRFLDRKPDACIYTVIAHNPILALGDGTEDLEHLVRTQRIVIGDEPYIDTFGLYVYIRANAAWDKRSDVDLRFRTNQYPYHHLEPELLIRPHYDLFTGRSPR